MSTMRKGILKDERGQEPTVMKILVGIILVAIGLGIGITVYNKFGGATESYLNYSTTATPSSGTIMKGSSESISIDVSTNVEFDENVYLEATGVPENVEVAFNPSSGTPPFGATMIVTVGENAQSETQTLTIRASTTDGDEKTATYDLEITE
ncbi:hypothetical protein AKJ55_00330 [candidate division MSBL1 archaeon SCGC-AAA382M17]|uniref:Uncharacterized protein n=1 Tax=candidate division MSBL1 archaeon SCGC-AAA382M17 TaxID=1698284 RepID=A0ABR5TK12_9EURY|nr:hypothetical protein AKJ55_00330 [candidate division MSBL1 archaeon SCGC-AAA382M17]